MALTVFESAMLAEIVRGGLNSIEKGQMEAARSSGLTYVQALRTVILPQALRRMVPNLVSQFISLLKDTSLAVVIALPELLHHAKIIQAQHAKLCDSNLYLNRTNVLCCQLCSVLTCEKTRVENCIIDLKGD